MSKIRQFIQRIFNILAVGGLAHQLAGIAVILLIWGENMAYSFLESTLKKPFNFEKQIMKIGKVIKNYGVLERKKAWSESEKVIEELVK